MTTNANDRILQLVGQLIAHNIDRVPDEQVIDATKLDIHEALQEGAMYDQPRTGQEARLIELLNLLGFHPDSSPDSIEADLFDRLDSYDLFND